MKKVLGFCLFVSLLDTQGAWAQSAGPNFTCKNDNWQLQVKAIQPQPNGAQAVAVLSVVGQKKHSALSWLNVTGGGLYKKYTYQFQPTQFPIGKVEIIESKISHPGGNCPRCGAFGQSDVYAKFFVNQNEVVLNCF